LIPSITTGCARLPPNMPTACFPGAHANRKNARWIHCRTTCETRWKRWPSRSRTGPDQVRSV